MSPKFRFAPVSSAPSTRLRVASGYMMFVGVSNILLLLLFLSGIFFDAEVSKFYRDHLVHAILGTTIFVLISALSFWVGVLLGNGDKKGGVIAIALFAYGIVPFVWGARPDGVTLFISILGLIVIASVWNELHWIKRAPPAAIAG